MVWIFIGTAALMSLWVAAPTLRSVARVNWRPTVRNDAIAFQAQRSSSHG